MELRRRKLTTKALEKRLSKHDRFCGYYQFSGSRRCTCGRNQAIAELRVLLKRLEKAEERQLSFLKEDA